MKTCIVPHCGREVGSKGTPHEPDSCGRPSCDLFSRGAAWQREQDGGEFAERLRRFAERYRATSLDQPEEMRRSFAQAFTHFRQEANMLDKRERARRKAERRNASREPAP